MAAGGTFHGFLAVKQQSVYVSACVCLHRREGGSHQWTPGSTVNVGFTPDCGTEASKYLCPSVVLHNANEQTNCEERLKKGKQRREKKTMRGKERVKKK